MVPPDTMHELTFEELCKIVAPIARKYGMSSVYLFGSRARGDNGDDSDFDFCVAAPKGFSLFNLGEFVYDLEEALGREVDVISEEGIHVSQYLKEEMLRDRKIVFEA